MVSFLAWGFLLLTDKAHAMKEKAEAEAKMKEEVGT